MPVHIIFHDRGLLDIYPRLIPDFTALHLPLVVFFWTGFIRGVPLELEEATQLNNCPVLRIVWNLIQPLLGPATATLFLFIMLMGWNDFTCPLLLLTDE